MTAVTLAGRVASFEDLAQGLIPLTPNDIQHLVSQLHVDAPELTRPLTPDEMDAWRFYRISVQAPSLVWEQVAAVIQKHDISLADASGILGMRPAHLADALFNPDTHRVLTYETAQLLTNHLKLPGGPLDLIPPPEPERQDDHMR